MFQRPPCAVKGLHLMLIKLNHKGSKLTSAEQPGLPAICAVIMVIVNNNHNLHTLPSIPLGSTHQGQHAAV